MGSRKLLHWGKFTKVRGNKEMVGFLFNDFFLLVRPKSLFVTAAQLEPFTDNQFTMYREPFLLDQIQVKKGPVDQYGPSVFIVMLKTDAKKEIPLKAETDSGRDKWVKQIMEACVEYVRKQKQSSKLIRSDSRRMTLRKVASGKLFVTVVEAADLIASSADGKSDPFCVIRVGDNQESATPVIKNDLNPK
ncbi:PREDICTED: intersectin-1-like [Amphimedon queenslandica]|nr:PREDICTED: intersectin-1-like [Amphimedon queenslandica]XP_019854028.1 PREDICTED: intersectin-1-like [Amphimedon queenslandica]XP_019854029.1 PREDICTED: intersectin-1-like [Amphimedon queenslandica]|eukprot:XP_019854027.1 PREDICTED: intersectin-1-like [Amphimedon queenslandica]